MSSEAFDPSNSNKSPHDGGRADQNSAPNGDWEQLDFNVADSSLSGSDELSLKFSLPRYDRYAETHLEVQEGYERYCSHHNITKEEIDHESTGVVAVRSLLGAVWLGVRARSTSITGSALEVRTDYGDRDAAGMIDVPVNGGCILPLSLADFREYRRPLRAFYPEGLETFSNAAAFGAHFVSGAIDPLSLQLFISRPAYEEAADHLTALSKEVKTRRNDTGVVATFSTPSILASLAVAEIERKSHEQGRVPIGFLSFDFDRSSNTLPVTTIAVDETEWFSRALTLQDGAIKQCFRLGIELTPYNTVTVHSLEYKEFGFSTN